MSDFEQEPDEIILNVSDGSEILVNRYNTTLFTFFGELATRNHVFIQTGESEDETVTGFYIFSHASVYHALVERIAAFDFPMQLNSVTIPKCDEEAFIRSIDRLAGSMEDITPEDFID